MADPMSMVNSVVGLLSGVQTLIRTTDSMKYSIRDTPAEIETLNGSLREMEATLKLLMEDLRSPLSIQSWEEKLIQSTTTESTEVLKSISHFVEKWKGVNIAKEGTKFGRDEPRITALTNQLDDRISSFDTLHHLLSSRIHRERTELLTNPTLLEQRTRGGWKGRERQMMLNWLSTYDFEARHLDLQAMRLNGTCQWFLQSETYTRWCHEEVPSLWVEGMPGVGKSVLCSFIIDDLRNKWTAHSKLAYIYFDHRDRRIQSKETILLSLLLQFSLQLDEAPSWLHVLWNQYGRRGKSPDYHTLRYALRSALSINGSNFMCVDGVDELDEELRHHMIKILHELSQDRSVTILAFSRPSSAINKFNFTTYHMKAAPSDISHYIQDRLIKFNFLKSRESLRENLCEMLSSSGDGVFLVVALQIDDMLEQRTPSSMRNALESIPNKLYSIYQDNIDRMAKERPYQYNIARNVFYLMLRAFRPLRAFELQVCVALARDEDDINSDDAMTDIPYIIDCCANFVIVEEEQRIVSFAHHTVKKFMQGLKSIHDRNLDMDKISRRFPHLFVAKELTRDRQMLPSTTQEHLYFRSTYGSQVFSQFPAVETEATSVHPAEDLAVDRWLAAKDAGSTIRSRKIPSTTQDTFYRSERAYMALDDQEVTLERRITIIINLCFTSVLIFVTLWPSFRFIYFIICLLLIGFGWEPIKSSGFQHLDYATQFARIRVHILNWRDVFVDTVFQEQEFAGGDLTHFRWTCRCGRKYKETICELVSGAAEEWVQSMASGQEDNGEGSSAAGGPGAAEEWVQSMASGQEDNGEGSSAVGGPGAIQKPDSSVTERGNGKGKSRADDREANDSRDQELGSDGDSKANIQELEDDPIHPEYVQLCIKQDHLRTKLAQPDIKDKRNDKETFKSLKLNYQQYRPAWWRLTTLSHVEFKRFGLYHTEYQHGSRHDYVDVGLSPDSKEEVPVCSKECQTGCGNGCAEYWYTPPKAKFIPPVPRKAMVHFLESPECLGTMKKNRGVLPKRRHELLLGDDHMREGWGLNFKEKVWSLPIVLLQGCSVIAGIATAVVWTALNEKTLGSFVPGAFVLVVGQSVAALLQKWAESNLDVKIKE